MSERDSKKLRNEERNNVTIVHTETNVKSKTDAKEREQATVCVCVFLIKVPF